MSFSNQMKMEEIGRMDIHELGEVLRERCSIKTRKQLVEEYCNDSNRTPIEAAILELLFIGNDAPLRYKDAAISALSA